MNILFVDACISTHDSRTGILCDRYLKRFDNTRDTVTHVVLETLGLKPFTKEMLLQREALAAEKAYEHEIFQAAHQFQSADLIIVGAPYWDLSFPSMLKIYVEHIMANGLTFTYKDDRPVGLCRAKKLVYIMSAGGIAEGLNFGYEYMSALAQHMFGIPETECICAQGLDIEGADVGRILDEAL